MVERQVRWNLETDTGEQVRPRYKYFFVIINKPKEIRRIRERILGQLASASEFDPLCDYLFENSGGLHGKVFSFLSERGRIEHPEAIYDNLRQFKKDRDLGQRTEEQWIFYLKRFEK